jgi:signal peptidase II
MPKNSLRQEWNTAATKISKLRFTPTRGASNWLWLSFFVILLDQITKAMITRSLDLYDTVEILPVLKLTHLYNTGAAFSMLANAGGWQRWFFIGLAIIVSIVLMIWLRRIRTPEQTLLAVGLSLILGGALGNVIDRVWLGHVVDFIFVHWGDSYFPAFNVADSAITVGAGCLLLDAFLESGREKKRERSKRENPTG